MTAIFQTNQLLLRYFEMNDLEALAPILANSDVMRFSLSGPLSKDQVKEYLQKRILDHYTQWGFGLYAVIFKETRQLIGFVGLISQTIDGVGQIDLGYRLDPLYWGKGLATEAAMAVCQYAFEQLKIERIISIIEAENVRSIQVANRIGMRFWKETVFHGTPVRIYSKQSTCRIKNEDELEC